jgi:predicted ATP-grasp superfamily ATP-dependent carboligase
MSSDESGSGVRVVSKGLPEKLTGGVVIDGFPVSGLAGTIASTCLISSLKLALSGELASNHFPPLATVLDGRLQAPARIYADATQKIAIFIGDFPPGPRASVALARTIIEWAKHKECAFVLTSFSTTMEEGVEEHEVSAVVNGDKARELAEGASIPLARLAAVGGVAGRLLLEGRDEGVPVIALLIKSHKGIQDFESGLRLTEAVMKLVPNARCDLDAIREEAQRTEGNLRRVWKQTAPAGVYG